MEEKNKDTFGTESRNLDSQKFSEAIYTISPCLFSLVRDRILTPHVELECIILWKTNEDGKVTNNLPSSEFKSLLQDVLKNHSDRITLPPTILNEKKEKKSQFIATEDRFYLSGRIRETTRRKIQDGKSSFEKIWIQKDRLDREVFIIPQLPNGLCVHTKTEIPLTSDQINHWEIGSRYPLETTRTKQRFSFWWKKKPFRTDFTVVHSRKHGMNTNNNTSPAGVGVASYQIETEFVSDPIDLNLCQLSLEEFGKKYDFQSPLIPPEKIRIRENLIASELLELSLFILQPEKSTSALSISRYPLQFYIG